MTINYQYITQGMEIPSDIDTIIEPFCGNGDLLKLVDRDKYKLECYDIEPLHEYIVKRDTIAHPPEYTNKYILTNPPYLARNKSSNKTLFDKYATNDLYKCLLKELLSNTPLGGILIIPLNFWCSIRKSDVALRESFVAKFDVVRMNIFEEKVFDDTTYTICCFQFKLKAHPEQRNSCISPIALQDEDTAIEPAVDTAINVVIYPAHKKIQTILNKNNNYTFGGDIYHLPTKGIYQITRLTSKNELEKNTNILAKCIDDNQANKISLSIVSNE